MAIDPSWIEDENRVQQRFFAEYISKKLNKNENVDFFRLLEKEGDYARALRYFCTEGNLHPEEFDAIRKMRTAWRAKVKREEKRNDGIKVLSFELTNKEFRELKSLSANSKKSMTLIVKELINGSFREWLEIQKIKEQRLQQRYNDKKRQKEYEEYDRRIKEKLTFKPEAELASEVAELRLAVEQISNILAIWKS